MQVAEADVLGRGVDDQVKRFAATFALIRQLARRMSGTSASPERWRYLRLAWLSYELNPGGAEPRGVETRGVETRGAETRGAETRGSRHGKVDRRPVVHSA